MFPKYQQKYFLKSHTCDSIETWENSQTLGKCKHWCIRCLDDSLGIGLFQEGAPELISIWGAEVNQLVVHSGQQVVYPHLLPLAILPELATGGDRGRSRSTSQLRTHRGCSSVQWLLFLGHLLWRWSSRCIRPGSSVLAASPSSAESDSQRETRWQRATSSRLKKGGKIRAEDKRNGSIYVLMTFLDVLPLGLMYYFIAVAVITN